MRRTTKGLLFSAAVLLAAMPALAGRHGWGYGPGDFDGPRYERGEPHYGCYDADARRQWREDRREARDAWRAKNRENCRDLARADTPREERLALRQMRRDRMNHLRDRMDRWEERRAWREACRNRAIPAAAPQAAPAPPPDLP